MKTPVYKNMDKEVARLLKEGKVGVIPSDTVYGIVSLASNEQAVKRLYELKSREKKPGTLVAANIDDVVDLGFKRRYLKAVEDLWPNPLSIQIPHQVEYIHGGTGRSAVRIPGDDEFRAFLEKTGALMTSSANLPGQPHANTLKEAQDYFGDSVDFYVDGGDLSSNEPSTIIGVIDDEIEIYREGALSEADLIKIRKSNV